MNNTGIDFECVCCIRQMSIPEALIGDTLPMVCDNNV